MLFFVATDAKRMKPEKKGTEKAGPLRLNDIGFRLVLVPFFGIAIPLLTHMIDADLFTHWGLKLAYGYTVLLAFVIWQGNRYLFFSLRSYFDWFNKPVRKILVLLFSALFFTLPVSSVMLVGWYYLFQHGAVNWPVVNTSTLIIMICVLFIVHVYETVFLVKESESEMLRNEQLERAKAEAELQALKTQIDPHFMFNSLNTLSYLIDEAPPKAKRFNEHLADVYRYILQNRNRHLVMVGEEVQFLADYFALQTIRYGRAVRLQVTLAETVLNDCLLPPISLQLLAENAFKHNEFSLQHPLVLELFAENDTLVMRNRKTAKAFARPSQNIGLANLSERYQLTTGFTIGISNAKDYFTVRLPLLKMD